MVRIGDSIEVFVITARNGHARLTISAPRNLEITAPKQ
ncbi:TPA: carbon storage regulator [Stenotrophomonas maltophilia]|nr:carbon storage regulator [Stenotrophomonas maltophilia]